jgi:hypothetical protein
MTYTSPFRLDRIGSRLGHLNYCEIVENIYQKQIPVNKIRTRPKAIADEAGPLPIRVFIRKPFQFVDLLNTLRNAQSGSVATMAK